ncbi:hypothetical protein [Ruegeria jejuensis]|uniref:hypothetical protein n=1 Tax=Ruegeria jejuensis TaxID=3233338 RepID=UPI00355C5255
MSAPGLLHRSLKPALVLCLAGALAACGQSEKDQILFDGQAFRTKASAVDKRRTRAEFTVTIDDVTRSLDGAREAGRYQGTRYCIENYGNSDIKWAVGPDTDPAQLRVVDGRLTFQGICQRP